jgi:hypothetical protein
VAGLHLGIPENSSRTAHTRDTPLQHPFHQIAEKGEKLLVTAYFRKKPEKGFHTDDCVVM